MRNISLILGALIAVGTVSQAKEQVFVAPMVEEVIVAEPMVEDVIIVMDDTFKPSGYVGLEYKAYGKTENHGDSIVENDKWNRGKNNYSRLQTTFGVQGTENFRLEGRIRDYNDLERADGNINSKQGTDTRLRAYYDHNDSFTSRIEFRDTESNEERYEYQLRYNAYTDKGGLIDKVVIAPKIGRREAATHKTYKNRVGTDLYLTGNLPFGMTWENNYYLNYDVYNRDQRYANGKVSNKELSLEVEFYLYKTFELYTMDRSKFDLNFEGGYDPYAFYQHKRVLDRTSEYDRAYSLYSKFDLTLSHELTENVVVKTGLGAEYRNWDIEVESRAKDWRWQPYAFAAMNIKF